MIIRYPKTIDPGGPEKAEKAATSRGGASKDEDCRCIETSQMSPGQLFRLMMSDLAFWKKMKPPKS